MPYRVAKVIPGSSLGVVVVADPGGSVVVGGLPAPPRAVMGADDGLMYRVLGRLEGYRNPNVVSVATLL